ncbi:MAG: lipopolysaccharide heptosyltransferase II [Candidatus Aadella gelida]|nr:lipopolysaccharide heptosyltransferase II [Candidatus Aadella gelida]
MNKKIKKPRRILITRTDRMGDVVLSTSVIRSVRKQFPEAYIAFMVRPENKDIVMCNPDLNRVIVYDKYGLQKKFFSTVKFAFALRKDKFDTAIMLHPTNRVHIMSFLAGISKRIGYDKDMGWLLTNKMPHKKNMGERHETDYNKDLLAYAGFDVSGYNNKPYMYTTSEDKGLIDSIEKSHSLKEKKIALHVGASCASKRWPPERFAKVADVLIKEYGCDVVLIGADKTEKYSSLVVSSMKENAVDLTDNLLLGELAELLSRCMLFISNDSGPVHIASAVGTPAIVVFGRNDPGLSPKRWGPLGEKDIVLHEPPGCMPCKAHYCEKGFKCLMAVTQEDVIAAAHHILSHS